MISSLSSGSSYTSQYKAQPGGGFNIKSAPESKLKLDLDSIPENKLKLSVNGGSETGKGLKIDIKV